MSGIKIITKPNPLLKQICKEIAFPLSQQVQNNIKSLKHVFRDSFVSNNVKTLGLAAPQIGVLQRFFIMPKKLNYQGLSLQILKSVVRNYNVYINPKIVSQSQSQIMIKQNCLSIGPGIYEVIRSENITVQYYNIQGQKIKQDLSGIRARVFLHQNDHLDGITADQRGKLSQAYEQKEIRQYLEQTNSSTLQNEKL